MKTIHIIAHILLVIGGLNWLLVGAFDFDLVAFLFGPMTLISRIVYILVGISAVVMIFTCKKICRNCEAPKIA